ncbi:MAG: ABC transporter substrate-binding protein [Hyphomicrobiales bacterium]|nr:ABC transporter substrate-binding protein [Hyphomicrobiales bacterium]
MKKAPSKRNKSLTRRSLLKSGAALGVAGSLPLFNINHAWSQDVTYDGGIFDAEGATINIGEWGGFWEEFVNKNLLDQFKKDFNCDVSYDSSWPWFPKFVAGGPQNPVYDIANWNLTEMFKTARAGDYFVSEEEIRANVPNAADCWDFAFENRIGVTWGFGQYCYAYRTDIADPAPTAFRSFWDEQYAGGKRGTYITSNTLQMIFFLTASHVFGGDYKNLEAGYEAMRTAMPMKISDFTGNMQTLIERGEVVIGVQWEGEVYNQIDKGAPIGAMLWEELKPILTQTKTISRYSDPVAKKLAFALLNRTLSPEYGEEFGKTFYMRPTNKKTPITPALAAQGVTNTADATNGMWIPDWYWYLDNEDDVVETVNEIFAG